MTFPLIQCDKYKTILHKCQDVRVFVSDLSQVVLAADMLGLEGLKDVAEIVLTRDYCRFFPKVRPEEGVTAHSFSLFEAKSVNSPVKQRVCCQIVPIALSSCRLLPFRGHVM